MSDLIDSIKQLAKSSLAKTIAYRRHLHAHPELSFEEFNTSAYICAALDELKIPYKTGFVKTGIVALIEGKNPAKKTVALRADMDALPITETGETEYKSKNSGVMHACGHDVHSASLLGAAGILNQLRDRFEGTVKLIFQPGEEKLPGGASLMIAEGVLNHPSPEAIFAQHVFPSLPAGKVGFRSGMYMASTDELYITIKGKGGHAAMPQDYVNPIIVGSTIITALHALFMEEKTKITPAVPTVLAFGRIEGLGATNVIPDTVHIQGTFRTMHEEWREKAHVFMKSTAETLAKEMGAVCDFEVRKGYPYLINHPDLTGRAQAAAEEFLGKENVTQLDMRMTAEDFAYFSQQLPACFYRLGTASPDGRFTKGVHTSDFDIDENALETGMGLLAWITYKELGC
ncbi:MAG: amidohydrolase [Bacteroidetes bacterium]|nr:MAG: amidohydrolase [Bacteroidota bacterium]